MTYRPTSHVSVEPARPPRLEHSRWAHFSCPRFRSSITGCASFASLTRWPAAPANQIARGTSPRPVRIFAPAHATRRRGLYHRVTGQTRRRTPHSDLTHPQAEPHQEDYSGKKKEPRIHHRQVRARLSATPRPSLIRGLVRLRSASAAVSSAFLLDRQI
ncbi:hypothetical protein EJB05_15963, partial [Eragrostis curvula]